MGYDEGIAGAIGVLIISGVVIGFLLMIFTYLGEFFNDYNTNKAKELRKYQEDEARDREFLTQAKRHTINYTEKQVKSIKEENSNKDFKVDFDINLGGSIVKTEIVYAE